MMLDTGAMYVLTQLQAEVERVRGELALVQESYSHLRRVVGLFYDAGCEDTEKRLGRHRKGNLRALLLIPCMAAGLAAAAHSGTHQPWHPPRRPAVTGVPGAGSDMA
jgi:hypothetical protein